MDVHFDYVETADIFCRSNLSFDNINYFKAEDSGYHTSFTPGSLERSDISSDYRDQSLLAGVSTKSYLDEIPLNYVTPERNYRYGQLKPYNDNSAETPQPRRGIKRSYSSLESASQTSANSTPTTWIAGKIQSLEVNEDKENTSVSIPAATSHSIERNKRYFYRLNICEQTFSYPTTPVKRNCRTPCRKSGRKLDLVIHSLGCEKHELQTVPEQVTQTKLIQPILARPDQKIDIIRLLNDKCAIPPIECIFQYLSNEDICNFCSVSTTWKEIWNLYNNNIKKAELKKHKRTAKENQENVSKDNILKNLKSTKPHDGCLKEIHNEINGKPDSNIPISPQYSPRTNRFRKFIKSASLDSRLQLSCVRCSQPAKVTEEVTGEEWVECTNASCSFQFCRSCNCSRHPGKSCVQYDLNAPSPSKRKKCDYAIGTKKSRRNLRRLL